MKDGLTKIIIVSILIVMEDGLVLMATVIVNNDSNVVLILVVMDNGLVQWYKSN